MDDRPTFVFGFGSLVGRPAAAGHLAELHGFRRTWDVAMDNRVTLPGYKYYVDPVTGERPEVFVTFVNLCPAAGMSVNGYCMPVTAEQLGLLDERERNYRRIEVSEHVEPCDGARVFAYVGRAEARARYEEGLAAGTAVVHAAYHRGLGAAFERLGPEAARRFAASTDPPSCVIRELTRVDVPVRR